MISPHIPAETQSGDRVSTRGNLQEELDRFRDRLLLLQASQMARRGHLEGAAGILVRSVESPAARPDLLDLLARIRAQQRRFPEAVQLWNRVLGISPADKEVLWRRERALAWQSKPGWLFLFPGIGKLLALAIVPVVLLVIVYAFGRYTGGGAGPVHSDRGVAREQAAVGRVPDIRLNLPGVVQHREGNEIVISFDKGLFRHGVQLTASSGTLLKQVGVAIAACPDRLTVFVVGYTDSIPMPEGGAYLDNSGLGIRRASVVMDCLRSSGSIPGEAFIIGTSGETKPRFPNDTWENRLKNRTADLRITVSKGNSP